MARYRGKIDRCKIGEKKECEGKLERNKKDVSVGDDRDDSWVELGEEIGVVME